MRSIHARGVLAVFLLLVMTRTAAAIDGTPFWFTQELATVTSGFQISSPTLAWDHYGAPSVSWSRVPTSTGTADVFHSRRTALGLWSHHNIATGSNIGIETSMSFDRAERPTVAWIDSNGNVRAQFNGGTVQTVAMNGANSARPALSLSHDLAGNLRGVYAGSTVGQIFDISFNGTSFSTTNVATMPGMQFVYDIRLTTDDVGRRHFIARGQLSAGGDGAIIIGSEPGAGAPWSIATLTTTTDAMGVDIATDPTDGLPALAYTLHDSVTSTSSMHYAKFTGFELETTEILSVSSLLPALQDISMAFDMSDGRPAIAYEWQGSNPFSGELHMAYLDGGGIWQTSLVDDEMSIEAPNGKPRRPSLAFDDFGTSWPAIAYVDADGSLNVAFDPPVPEPATAMLMLLAAGLLRRRRSGLAE